MAAAAGSSAAAGSDAAEQLLDALLAEVADLVRPLELHCDLEFLNAQLSSPPPSPGELSRLESRATHREQARQAAEALLLVAEGLNSPEVRQRAGEHWAALAWEVEARLAKACRLSDDNCADLWTHLEQRPSYDAAQLTTSLRDGPLGFELDEDELLRELEELELECGSPATKECCQLEGLEPSVEAAGHSSPGNSQPSAIHNGSGTADPPPAASPLRPPLANKLSRFDPSWQAEADGGSGRSTAGVALAEARCEVTLATNPGWLATTGAGDLLAGADRRDLNEREVILKAGRIAADGRLDVQEFPSGSDEVCRVVADPARGWVWAWTEQGGIQAYDLNAGGSRAGPTLAAGAGNLLGVIGGRVFAALPGGTLNYWEIDRLTEQADGAVLAERNANEDHRPGSKDPHKLTQGMGGSTESGPLEPHGTIQLLPPEFANGRSVNRLLPLGACEGGTPPKQVVATIWQSNVLLVFDWHESSPRLHSVLAGHVQQPGAVSTCATLPHTLASASGDTLRVWDLRSGACTHVLTMNEGASAVALAEDQGDPFCFFSTSFSDGVLCVDLRTQRCVYELATGRTNAHHLQWHGPSRSLFAACSHDFCVPKPGHDPSDPFNTWDAGQGSIIVRYQFKHSPDLGLLPPGAHGKEPCKWSPIRERAGTYRLELEQAELEAELEAR